MKLLSLVASCAMVSSVATASTIAIVDSGVDYQHEFLQGRIWENPVDNTVNRRDEDNNGYRDDIWGWNFFGNNNRIIDYKYNDLFDSDIERFFQLQGLALEGTIEPEDLRWLQEKAQNRDFVARLNKFGAYVHGTHVASIAAGSNEDARILTIRLLPVDNPLQQLEKDVVRALEEGKSLNFILKEIIKGGLYLLAKAQGQAFASVGSYIHGHNSDVANASLGTGVMQAKLIIEPIVRLAMGGNTPDPKSVEDLAIFFVNRTVAEQRILVEEAPNTLFVFAAGNDGTNNDQFPVSPANISAENSITVGATFGLQALAPFSNYGQAVHVLAPGVAIRSAIPNDLYLKLSGTSQAAPYVAGLAAELKDINPALRPVDLKKIIMATVDQRDEFQDKVSSSGIVNRDRAIVAAEKSSAMPIAQAIDEARLEVKDQVSVRKWQVSLPENFPMIGIQ
ncbi:S8 family serine peptidase [Pseudobacteriovorax antillogorgiicola]|uniref:Subtilase family protein n=1 Tax=Pseudobacteriovorax antillogorgiicola TaxID=1513793 RepID=A0A1Y6BZR9_9BACT|nr:S8 family serine peptidase [Pseudobacteriovorax antillogorgiicola]TCS52387.1 subtilase family protein [Pseudobacteriovorax antillogorgiicola]SMF29174.1 Subtilase family protein [Pseudobacteriovorax antillogorgiicola]